MVGARIARKSRAQISGKGGGILRPIEWVAWVALSFGVGAVFASLAYGQPPAEQRLDLYDTKGNRLGYGKVQGDRIDIYNTHSDRLGYGKVQGNRIDLYNKSGERVDPRVLVKPGLQPRGGRR